MSPEQRPADEDEIKRAEREDTPETIERQRPATEEEIQEAEKEAKDESSTISNVGGSPASIQHGSTWPSHGQLPNAPHDEPAPVAEQRIAGEDEVEAAERKAVT
jgi:hypothetical protein